MNSCHSYFTSSDEQKSIFLKNGSYKNEKKTQTRFKNGLKYEKDFESKIISISALISIISYYQYLIKDKNGSPTHPQMTDDIAVDRVKTIRQVSQNINTSSMYT